MNEDRPSFRPVWISLVLLAVFLGGVYLVSTSQQIKNCFERGSAPCMDLSGEQRSAEEYQNQ